jgi:hypothetical protein
MKTAFTFKRWYWGYGHDPDQPPQWWSNFIKNKPLWQIHKELEPVAKIRQKSNGNFRVVFKSPADLSFFILRYS